MRYISAYLLAVLGGNSDPNAEDLKTILNAAGVTVDDTCLQKVISEVQGKDLESLIAEGSSKLANVSASSGVSTTEASSGAAVTESANSAKEEKEEPAQHESEDEDMGFSLFGDDD